MTSSRSAIFCVVLALSLVTAMGVQTLRLSRAETAIAELTADLKAARDAAQGWQVQAEAMQKGADALEAQAQSCLKREAAARADADIWRELLEKSTARDMNENETQGVPDDATRRKLCTDLDCPL